MKRLFLLLSLFLPLFSEETSEMVEPPFIQKFFWMLFCLGIILGFLWLLSKWMQYTLSSRLLTLNKSNPIKVGSQRVISQKTTLIEVEFEGKRALIAESMNGVFPLFELPHSTSKGTQDGSKSKLTEYSIASQRAQTRCENSN